MQGAHYKLPKLPDDQCSITESHTTHYKEQTAITTVTAILNVKKSSGQEVPNSGRIIFVHDGETKRGRISHLDVNNEFRRRGCGTRLLTYACDFLKGTACTTITLSAVPDDPKDLPKLIAFYQRFGFELDEHDRITEGPLCTGRTMHKKIAHQQ